MSCNLVLKTSLCLHSLSLAPEPLIILDTVVLVLVAHNHSHSQWAQTDHNHEVLLPTGQRTNYRTAVPSESDRTRCVPCGRPCLQRPSLCRLSFGVRFGLKLVQFSWFCCRLLNVWVVTSVSRDMRSVVSSTCLIIT